MLKTMLSRRMLVCILCGFSSGMPLYVLYQLIPAWLRDQQIDLKTIGLFSLVSFPYTWKFLWSPLMDRYAPPFLGRRRGWLLPIQIALLLTLAAFGSIDPTESLEAVALIAGITALFSASQDIVLDAHRRELLPDDELGIGNSFFVNAYRFSSLVPGSLALILADRLPWSQVHLVVASFMAVGILATLWMPEPEAGAPPASFKEAIAEPFKEFFERNGVRQAIAVLAFMLLYKLGDSMATALSTPFYLDLGFTMTEIGTVAKAAALWSSIAGGFIGGAAMLKIGINRALWIFGVVQLLSILGFAVLAEAGADGRILFAVVSFEYLGVGLGTAAFVAFIAKSTNKRYTATQLALLTSFTSLPRTFANASTGYIVESIGYTQFFLLCTVIAVPGMAMLRWVAPWNEKKEERQDQAKEM
jgi:MFS transporter, PAT family, beta-lactamase induction signal transducer AmpG